MWLPLSTFTALCIVLEIGDVNATHPDDGLEIVFRERSRSDWEKVWHQESHSRCREKLVRHLYWACEKDIYRLTRRSDVVDEDTIRKRSQSLSVPWLEKAAARNFLKIRRNRRQGNSGGSITAECCTRVGCTWEEYAEYCPSNKRKNQFVN